VYQHMAQARRQSIDRPFPALVETHASYASAHPAWTTME
jgi:hypothetical protein